MKRPKDDIFRLIRSMTPPEKRYFKLHQASSGNMLIELFNFINGMESYDEPAIKDHFSQTLAKNLKVHKIQLQELLLKSLSAFHHKKTVISKIRNLLEETDVLMEKQLYDLASDRIEKAKKLSLEFEEYTYLIEIANKELRLHHMEIDNIGLSRHPVYAEMRTYLEHLKDQIELSNLGALIIDRQKRDYYKIPLDENDEELTRILQSPQMTKSQDELSFRAGLSRNVLLSISYCLWDRKEEEWNYRKKNLELFGQFPHFKKIMPFDYLAILRNLVNFCQRQKMVEELQWGVREAESFIRDNPDWGLQLIYFYYPELVVFFELGRLDRILKELEPKLLQHIKKFRIEKERITYISFMHLALTHLALGNHAQVQRYLLKMNEAAPEIRSHFTEVVYILHLISHLESDDGHLAERELTGIERKLVSADPPPDPVYAQALHFFRQMVRHPYDKSRLAKEWRDWLDSYDGPKESKVLHHWHYNHLDCWLNALINRTSFSDELKRKFGLSWEKEQNQKHMSLPEFSLKQKLPQNSG